jgi:hypothetical protein
VDWARGPVVGTWQEPGYGGMPVTLSLVCDVLVKNL